MLQVIASILSQAGFETRIRNNSVYVSLNRKVDNMEVRAVLDRDMEDISFRLTSAGNEIKVNL